MRRAAVVSALALLTAAAQCPTGVPDSIIGQWGGEHAGMVVTADKATLEYDCATGRIDAPVQVSSDGRFEAGGEHVIGHGGPIRQDEVPDRHPAHYSGQVRGDTMTLTVELTDLKVTVGTFVLVRGKEARVFKCL